jgi:protein O-mannosyl-transferase
LVWWLSVLIFSTPTIKDHPLASYKYEIAFFTGLLFVSHPLATQSVTYIVQRMASMVAMFYIASVAFYLKASLTEKGSIYKPLFYLTSFCAGILALFTKENSYTLPFAIVLVELLLLRNKAWSMYVKNIKFLVLISGIFFFLIWLLYKFPASVFKEIPPNETHSAVITPLTYLYTQFNVILKYIQLLIFPINQKVDYEFPVSVSLLDNGSLISLFIILFLIGILILKYKKNIIIMFGIFWFFLCLTIESSIIPINDVIFEHRVYLPSFGFLILLPSLAYQFRGHFPKLLIFVLLVLVGINSILAYQRNNVWKTDISLWTDNIKKEPKRARAYYSRGAAYAKNNLWNEAIKDYTQAIKLFPRYSFSYSNRGIAYGSLKQWNNAIADYSTAVSINSKFTKAYFNRGTVYGELEQWNKAIEDYTKVISLDKDYLDAYSNRGIAYVRLGIWEKAIEDYSEAIRLNPNYAKGYYNRGVVYYRMKDWKKALDDFSSAILHNPKYSIAFNNRGSVYEQLGQLQNALQDYEKAVQIDPGNQSAINNLALLKTKVSKM